MALRPENCALVIPTNRPDNFKAWLDAWRIPLFRAGLKLIVVEDGPERSDGITEVLSGVKIPSVHMNWNSANVLLGDEEWIFSRRDSAIRSLGFLDAWNTPEVEWVVTLDDDCFPVEGGGDFFAQHAQHLSAPRWIESVPNTRTRGLPYFDLGKAELPVYINQGGWRGVPDLDSIQTLSGPCTEITAWSSRVMPRGQYAPLCGMNLAFRREAIPLMLFPMQGSDPDGKDWGFRRFDDIWAGIIAKKVADHLGWSVSVGLPTINHSRASDPMVNLVKEAPGISANEWFWRKVDAAVLTGTTPKECIRELGSALISDDVAYVAKLGQALTIWSGLF